VKGIPETKLFSLLIAGISKRCKLKRKTNKSEGMLNINPRNNILVKLAANNTFKTVAQKARNSDRQPRALLAVACRLTQR